MLWSLPSQHFFLDFLTHHRVVKWTCLTLCMLSNFALFFFCCCLWIFWTSFAKIGPLKWQCSCGWAYSGQLWASSEVSLLVSFLKNPFVLPLGIFLVLTLVLLKPDIPCLCKQCRSRSVGFLRSQLIWNCTVCHSVCEFISTTWIK